MKLKALILVATQLGPVIRLAVTEFEEALPEKGRGSDKLRAVLEVVQAAFAALDGVEDDWPQVKPFVEKWIGALVSLWNAAGIFRKA